MNYVLAKIKEKEDTFEKLYSGEELFSVPSDLDSAIDYEPARLLEEDEWFQLDNFSDRKFCIDLLKKDFRSTEYEEVKRARTETIEYICSYQENNYFFQRILKQNIFQKKRLTLGDNVVLDKGEKSIVINSTPDAVFLKEKNILYFKKLQTIAPIFRGIGTLYKEATKEETEKFLRSNFIALENGYDADKVKTMNRKRIAMAMDTLKGFSKKQQKEVLDYTHQYYPQLKYEKKEGIFTVGNEDDMKYLLWGIEQRYYTTPVTNEKRVANSITKL